MRPRSRRAAASSSAEAQTARSACGMLRTCALWASRCVPPTTPAPSPPSAPTAPGSSRWTRPAASPPGTPPSAHGSPAPAPSPATGTSPPRNAPCTRSPRKAHPLAPKQPGTHRSLGPPAARAATGTRALTCSGPVRRLSAWLAALHLPKSRGDGSPPPNVTGSGARHSPRSWRALLTRTHSMQGTDGRAGPVAPVSSARHVAPHRPATVRSRRHERGGGLCGLGVVRRGCAGAGGFAVVGDGGQELIGAAEPVEPWAQAGEVVHQRFEHPARAGADDHLRLGLVDGADGGGGHFLRAYRERGAGGQAGLGEGPGADPGVLDGAEDEAGGRHPGSPVVAVQHPAEGGKPVLGRGVRLGVGETGVPGQ